MNYTKRRHWIYPWKEAGMHDSNVISVGTFEAKTHFSELLRKVEGGTIVEITKNGKSIATLESTNSRRLSEAEKAHQRIQNRNRRIRQEQAIQGATPLTLTEIQELMQDGRKY